ncbi:MAG: Diaminopimelate decarboxylase [Alphaproteobacteria bacterium MarineAlpha11_Bin1]|nr:MAG: Diaminopimelate decarboxylase [Alphaproteobacteria bacterium MarineAlpha11_Bin1]|tara:strand:+ start:4186 stop:5454 length:1269 start_codon:yes stop_codon:yes gene_type:complete
MTDFSYRGGKLFAEDVPITEISSFIGTPFYCYSASILEDNYRRFASAFQGLNAEICYAVKANSNQAVISLFAGMGAGADVVSEGELRRSVAAGISGEKIVFSGVGKSATELAVALEYGCGQFNVESESELNLLSEVASDMGKTATIVFRVNPDVDADTHHKISTGRAGDKFGIQFERVAEAYDRARILDGIDPRGLAVHIGSQLTRLDPFRGAFEKIAGLVRELRAKGHVIERLDLGGGLGIVYRDEILPNLSDYADIVRNVFGQMGLKITFEPGRRLTGEAGILVTEVLHMKESGGRRFAIVDAAMNDLIRPTLYDAWHEIEPVVEPENGGPVSPLDIVGPVCETGDVFAVQRQMPETRVGDLFVLRSAGAYGAVMSSTYNSRQLVPEVMVKGDLYTVIRPRSDFDTLIGMDIVPDWIATE